MATHTVSKKRKSGEGGDMATKKVKVTKSATPLKSALKKTRAVTVEEVEITKPANGATVNGEKTITEEDDGVELTADQTAALLAGFSSDEEEENESEDESGIAVSSLPKPPTTKDLQTGIQQANVDTTDPASTPGVLYIGRIPHGFYERQMRAYFSQFGPITHLRLARNRKTGSSQHYAFIEFASASVADIVAKTMDKYLLFGHLLQVRRVPVEQVKDGMWGGRRRKPAPRNKLEGRKLKLGAEREVWQRRVDMERKRREGKTEKLREMGYEFEIPGVKDVAEVPVRPKEGVDEEADGGRKVVENGESNGQEVGEVQTIQAEPESVKGTEEVIAKKRPAKGEPVIKKAAKKAKTSA